MEDKNRGEKCTHQPAKVRLIGRYFEIRTSPTFFDLESWVLPSV